MTHNRKIKKISHTYTRVGLTQSIQQGIEPDFWSALWLSRLVCQRQMLIVRFGVRILLEIRKVFRLDNSILNKIEVPLK